MPDTAKLSAALADIRARFGARPGDVERLLAAVEVPLRMHHPIAASVPERPNLRICDRCERPWPCYEYEQIAKALLGEEDSRA
jgi:hypothetical protein